MIALYLNNHPLVPSNLRCRTACFVHDAGFCSTRPTGEEILEACRRSVWCLEKSSYIGAETFSFDFVHSNFDCSYGNCSAKVTMFPGSSVNVPGSRIFTNKVSTLHILPHFRYRNPTWMDAKSRSRQFMFVLMKNCTFSQ